MATITSTGEINPTFSLIWGWSDSDSVGWSDVNEIGHLTDEPAETGSIDPT